MGESDYTKSSLKEVASMERQRGNTCEDCLVLNNVLFSSLSPEQRPAHPCPFRPAFYRRNQTLFFEDGLAQYVFALRSGLVKLVKSLENGKDRITGVVLPGELLGL